MQHGSNVSGDANFYGADYDNNQFFLWKLLGSFGDGSGDPGSGLFGGLASLFIPSPDYFKNHFEKTQTWANQHLGILTVPFTFLSNFLNGILTANYSDPMVEIGPFTLPLNDDITLVPKITYHFNDLLQNENFDTIHDIYLLIIDGIIVYGLFRLAFNKYEEIIGGNHYDN